MGSVTCPPTKVRGRWIADPLLPLGLLALASAGLVIAGLATPLVLALLAAGAAALALSGST
ncbi:hypothetical protein ACQP1U_05890 [Actinomycetota bacterium]